MPSDNRQQLSLFGEEETAAQKAERYHFEPEIPLFPEAVASPEAPPPLELQAEVAAQSLRAAPSEAVPASAEDSPPKVPPRQSVPTSAADSPRTAPTQPTVEQPAPTAEDCEADESGIGTFADLLSATAEQAAPSSPHANAAPLLPSDYQDLAQVINRAQGGLANRSGRVLESSVISLFGQHGFQAVPHRLYTREPEAYGTELLLTDVPYTSIYGHAGKTEFLVRSQRLKLETRIECKWQQSSGSVDEKFPYLYLNCIFAMPEDHIIVVVDGGGAKPAAVTWLKQAATSRHLIPPDKARKRIDVHTLSEFMVWANRALR